MENFDNELNKIFNDFFGEELNLTNKATKKEGKKHKDEEKTSSKNNGSIVFEMFASQEGREAIFNSIFGEELNMAEKILKEDED